MKKSKYFLILIMFSILSIAGFAQPKVLALRLSKSAAVSISHLKAEAFTLGKNGVLRPGKGYVITESEAGFAFWNKKKKPPKDPKPDKEQPVTTIHCNGACDPCGIIETPGNGGETIVTCGTCDGCGMYARVPPGKDILQKLTPDGWRDIPPER